MIVARDFVFIHVPKTGGTFVNKLLDEHAPADWQTRRLEPHLSYADVPATHRGLPMLAFVRNPYSWYVSWFHYQQKKSADFFLEISDGGRLGFADSMRSMFKSGAALEHGEGPLLQTLWSMLGPGLAGARVGKMEQLRTDLLRLLGECCEVPDELAAAITSAPAKNVSSHQHYAKYYDDELRELVFEKDRAIFDHFDYRWEDA